MKFRLNIRVLVLLLLTISLSVAANMVYGGSLQRFPLGECAAAPADAISRCELETAAVVNLAKDTIVPKFPVKETVLQEEQVPVQRSADLKDPENIKTDFYYDETTGK